MAFPWGLLMLTPLLFGIQLTAPTLVPSVEYEDEDTSHHISLTVHDSRELTRTMEELRRRYLDERNKMEKHKNEVNTTHPTPFVRMDEIQRDITAVEMNLKARYLLFYKVMKSFNHSMSNVQSPGEAFSTLVDTLHELPEMGRELLFDYLNFIDGDGTSNETILSDPQPTHEDSNEMQKKSLQIIENSLVVAKNVFPGKVTETREPLTLAIQIIRMMLRGSVQVSFPDLEPFFIAVRNTGQYMDEKYPCYSNDNIEFPLSALYDALKELCNLAAKLNIRGQLLKYYFERRLGEVWENLDIRLIFSRIREVADAATQL